MTDVAVSAPDQTVWWDAADVAAAAMKVLRLETGDVDETRVAGYVPAAGELVNAWQDRAPGDVIPDPPPAGWTEALVQIVVELYRRKDAPPSSLDGALLGAWRPPVTDPLYQVRALMRGAKRRWGVG